VWGGGGPRALGRAGRGMRMEGRRPRRAPPASPPAGRGRPGAARRAAGRRGPRPRPGAGRRAACGARRAAARRGAPAGDVDDARYVSVLCRVKDHHAAALAVALALWGPRGRRGGHGGCGRAAAGGAAAGGAAAGRRRRRAPGAARGPASSVEARHRCRRYRPGWARAPPHARRSRPAAARARRAGPPHAAPSRPTTRCRSSRSRNAFAAATSSTSPAYLANVNAPSLSPLPAKSNRRLLTPAAASAWRRAGGGKGPRWVGGAGRASACAARARRKRHTQRPIQPYSIWAPTCPPAARLRYVWERHVVPEGREAVLQDGAINRGRRGARERADEPVALPVQERHPLLLGAVARGRARVGLPPSCGPRFRHAAAAAAPACNGGPQRRRDCRAADRRRGAAALLCVALGQLGATPDARHTGRLLTRVILRSYICLWDGLAGRCCSP
jgi:hypothetical protein